MTRPHSSLLSALPGWIQVVRCMVEREQELVAEARLGDERAALRAVRDPRAGALRELVTLASMEVQGVARILGHGPLECGGLWVAREWIDGRDLWEARASASPEEIGCAIASAARALHGVHTAGVVHGDVSPGNIIVDADGAGWLTDFGLAVAGAGSERGAYRGSDRGSGGGAGTPPFIAPELLVGDRPSPASDLFALAAVAAVLLGRQDIDVARFYGRFPAEPFLDAAGIDASQLPPWSVSPIIACLSRKPDERPRTALHFARDLEASLGLDAPDWSAQPGAASLPPIDHLAGRRSIVEEIAASPPGLVRLETRDTAETEGVARRLALELTASGRIAGAVDMAELAARAPDTLALDRAVSSEARAVGRAGGTPGILIVIAPQPDPWRRTCLAALIRAAFTSEQSVVVLVGSSARLRDLTRGLPEWRGATSIEVAPFAEKAALEILTRWLDAPDEAATDRLQSLAQRIDVIAGGSSGEVVAALDRVRAAGGISALDAASSLSPGYAIESLVPSARAALPSALSIANKTILAALALTPEGRPKEVIAEIADLPVAEVEPALDALSSEGLVRRAGHDRFQPCVAALEVSSVGLPLRQIRVLYGRLAALLVREGTSLEATWASRLASGDLTSSDASAEVADLARHGLFARIHSGLSRATTALEALGRPLSGELVGHHALAAARAGDVAVARRIARRTSNASLQSELEAVVASLDGRRDDAAKAFDEAGRTDRARVERAHAAFERGDLDALERWLDTDDGDGVRAGPDDLETTGAAVDLVGLAALGALRSGDGARAAALLDSALERARQANIPLQEGAILINIATVARRSGAIEDARTALEDARALYRSAGHAAGEAQTQSLLGGVLREQGELAAAEGPLASALARRSRSGDRVLAATSRGTLGLLRLERGHLRAALTDLAAAHRDLERAGRTEHARLLTAASDVAAARMGEDADGLSSAPTAERVALLHARAAWLRGDTAGAAEILSPFESDDVSRLSSAMEGSGCFDDDAAWLASASDPTEALHRATAALGRGADARAARLALAASALASEQGDAALEQSARRIATAALTRCMEGLSPHDEQAALHSLLGEPDPRPQQLAAWQREPEDDMDVMTILELNERLVREEDTGPLLGAIVESAIEISGAERGFLVLEEDGELVLDTAFDSSRGDVTDEDVEWSRSIVNDALASGRATRIGDAVEHADLGGARSIETLGLRSVLAAPFTVASNLRGVVVVDDRSRPGAFGPREERLLALLAGQAALAIRQVRRLEENKRLNVELGQRVVRRETQLVEAERALAEAGVAAPIEGLVGESEPIQRVRTLIHRVAGAALPVLITGPSGSGKEVAARAIHSSSTRSDGPFVSENCAALPPSLVESELFGAKRGSYTGADEDRAGLFERAEGGTLFLDEIGELPIEVQAKLLRVLETRRVRRLGEDAERPVDFRLVSATNRDLPAMVEEGTFRSDLMYRLDGVTIEMPPLDGHREDIPLLVHHFLKLEAARSGPLRALSSEVMRTLTDRAWPGNVRELANEVSRLILLSDGDITDPGLVRSPGPVAGSEGGSGALRTIAEIEREAILDALERTDGDKREAAALLGISRAKIYQRLKEWGLT